MKSDCFSHHDESESGSFDSVRDWPVCTDKLCFNDHKNVCHS